MMYKSQFWKIDPYDWFCAPGSRILFLCGSGGDFSYKNSLKFSQSPKQLCLFYSTRWDLTYDTWLSELYDVSNIL